MEKLMDLNEYVSEDGTYLIPVTWEVYSTIRVKADNLQDAIDKATEHIDEIPLGTLTEYIDGSYELDLTGDLIIAQSYYDMSDKTLVLD